MKILLTGSPGIGKSTVLQKTKELYPGVLGGIWTEEVRNKQQERVGFRTLNMQNESRICAHKEQFLDSPLKISSYHVDTDCIQSFIVPAITAYTSKVDLLLIDEIGRMQALSSEFLDAVRKAFSANIDVLATIVLDAEPWSLEFKEDPSAILITVTRENREQLPEVLRTIFTSNTDFLHNAQKNVLLAKTREYLQKNAFIQVKKLYRNALPYLAERRIAQTSPTTFEVHGNHHVHRVTYLEEYSCDCDLFNGKGVYQKQAGECSHIQAVKLFIAK